MSLITYLNKVLGGGDPTGECKAADMNEIKAVVNENAAMHDEILVDTSNGYGSTNNKIRRWTNNPNTVGTSIVYADSATLGGTFTIAAGATGMYSIVQSDIFNTSSGVGTSKNSTQLTTAIQSITRADRLFESWTNGNAFIESQGGLFYLLAGDVIRAHNAGAPTSIGDEERAYFKITRVK